jgi:hypothetical protein
MNELDNPFHERRRILYREPGELPEIARTTRVRQRAAALDALRSVSTDRRIPCRGISAAASSTPPRGGLLSGGGTAPLPEAKPAPAGKLKLQKVHRSLPGCTRGAASTARAHDDHDRRLRVDGLHHEEVADQIREIMRMAPETRGEVEEIGPNEFVSELYVLNRILDPEDATLDRDMIEVLMLARHRTGEQGAPSRDTGDTWIELLDRI